ncbi:MAG: glutamyl-tRNA reductase [Dehalococcoidia bacterium]
MLVLAGISHKTAPVEVRERFALNRGECELLLPALREHVGASVVLSTCNRTEVYAMATDPGFDPRDLPRFLVGFKRLEPDADADRFYCIEQAAVVRHLFRVSAGIESMVLGEAQILGQVRDALLVAEQVACADPLLVRLFQTAIAAGRRVRTSTGIAHYAVSLSSAAVSLARAELGDLRSLNVLVVSAGEAGKLTARSLLEAGAGSIVVSSRTFSRATDLAAQLGGSALPFDNLADGLRSADIVISATGARSFQIDRAMVAQAMASRPSRPLLLIDLAVPRDVEPSVQEIAGVSLYDIDHLQTGVSEGIDGRLKAVGEVEAQVELEIQRFLTWWQNRRVVPTIAALRDQAEAIRRTELAKTLGRLPNLSSQERGRIEALTAAIVNKLLHQPIARLKELEDDTRYLDTVRELFALQPAGAD